MEKEDGSGSGMGPDDSGELSSEVLGFNLALFPGSSIFASPMLQKLQGSHIHSQIHHYFSYFTFLFDF